MRLTERKMKKYILNRKNTKEEEMGFLKATLLYTWINA